MTRPKAIKKLTPTSMREVNSFLEDFSKISKPLIGLLMKDDEFNFITKFLESFCTLKKALVSTPIIHPSDWSA